MATCTRYTLALSAEQQSFTTQKERFLPEVEVNLQITRRFSFVNDFTDHRSNVRNYRYDHATFLGDQSANTAFREMFVDILIDSSKCKFLVPYLSSFARRAAIKAADDGVRKLVLLIGIGEEIVHEDDSDGISRILGGEARCLPESCAVCLDGFSFSNDDDIFSTPCFHVFHRRCIQRWINRSHSCPLFGA